MPRCETLRNGLRVVTVPCEAESVAVGIFISSGSRNESPKTAGISHFIEHMLFKGTPTRKPIDISRAIEGRGGNFNACTGEEATCYYAHVPREYIAEAVDILTDMYRNALIPQDEFDREKRVIIDEIKMYDDEPDSVAAENLQRAIFPKSQLGSPVAGSPESLGPMKPADLKRYMKSHYLPSNTVVVVAGDCDEGDAVRLVSKALGDIRRPAKPLSCDDANEGAPVAEVTEERDINQAQLALGYRTFGVQDPRKYAAAVMDAILGRGMSSRLFQELREKQGISYDISSRMQFFSDAGIFAVTAGFDPSKRQRVIATVERELKRIREKPVSVAELNRTKEFLAGNFRLGHERVTNKMFFYGQSMLAFDRIVLPEEQVNGIRSVTAAEIKAAANAIFRPENRSVSWVLPSAGGVA